jgi:hypothetical protein
MRVVGVDLAGNEYAHPPEKFEAAFTAAHEVRSLCLRRGRGGQPRTRCVLVVLPGVWRLASGVWCLVPGVWCGGRLRRRARGAGRGRRGAGRGGGRRLSLTAL